MVSHEKIELLISCNMGKNRTFLFVILCSLFFSCQNGKQDKINDLVLYWQGREIVFPQNSIFTLLGEDTVDMQMEGTYKIVSYLDSMGCISCKAQLPAWKELVTCLKSEKVPVLIFMNNRNLKEIQFVLKRETFNYPVCIDENDSLNKLNHFPSDMVFQTFLLDKDNKVLAIGNPVHNPKIRELYLKIIRGEKTERETKAVKTKVYIDKTSAILGDFDWQQEQKAVFILKNAGDKPLVIEGVNTSCGCTSVSYSKEPVQPGKDIALEVTYKADQPEHFNKTITVYCNADTSPIVLKISGNAK